MGGKLEVEVEVKSAADKFWHNIRDSNTLFPKVCSDLYKTIQVLEGDGKSVGSVRLVTYADETPLVSFAKEKIEAVDEGKMSVGYRVIDGELMEYYKDFRAHLIVSPKADGNGSLVKWWCEFEKTSHEIPDPDAIRDFAVKNLKELDAYTVLQAQP